MPAVKKLLFAPFFLIVFALLAAELNPLLSSYEQIFSLSAETLIRFVKIAVLFSASSLLFAVFASLAKNWKIILPVVALSALMPLLFMPFNLAIIFTFLCAISFFLASLALGNTLKTYLSFNASSLIGPSVRTASALLIISFSIIYFLASSKAISQTSFEIPDSLIDAALKMTPLEQAPQEKNAPALPDINITAEQISKLPADAVEMVKKNPQLLKQYGLDPKILNTLPSSKSSTAADLGKSMIKQTVKEQMQNIIKPYESFIPVVLTLLLFFTLQSLTALVNLLFHPVLWLIFLIFEKTGYIKFEVEQRPVKKLVV